VSNHPVRSIHRLSFENERGAAPVGAAPLDVTVRQSLGIIPSSS
jgi:hypothetical protein